MGKKPLIRFGYVMLLTLSLGLPLLHHYQTDRAIEAMRPSVRTEDGSYSRMLLPAPILLLRWFGQLSSVVPVGLLVAFVLSFWRKALAEAEAFCLIAVCQCGFTTVYAVYATLLLGSEWLRPGR